VAALDFFRRRFQVGEGVEILDGGTLGLSLLPYLEGRAAVILVDAIRGDSPPGSFVRLEGDQVAPAVRDRLSVHQIGVADLLDGARLLGRYPEELVLLGLVPESLELRVGLSEGVAAGIPILVEACVHEIQRLGYEVVARPGERSGDHVSPASAWPSLPHALGL
jgi:hydrogenase maturation protease